MNISYRMSAKKVIFSKFTGIKFTFIKFIIMSFTEKYSPHVSSRISNYVLRHRKCTTYKRSNTNQCVHIFSDVKVMEGIKN